MIVVSHAWWSTHLGGDPGAVGRDITVNGRPYRLIGVAPPGFHGVFTPLRMDAWVPLAMQPHLRPGRDLDKAPWLWMFGRMRDGVVARAGARRAVDADRAVGRVGPPISRATRACG